MNPFGGTHTLIANFFHPSFWHPNTSANAPSPSLVRVATILCVEEEEKGGDWERASEQAINKIVSSYVSVKKFLIGIGAVCPHIASSFSLSVRGTEWFGWMYFYGGKKKHKTIEKTAVSNNENLTKSTLEASETTISVK